jgi:hypothetical protein
MGVAQGNIFLPESLLAEIQSTAEAEHRSADEVAADAVRKYLDDQKWQQLVTAGERRAREKGLTEDDVPRLIEEVRRENRTRER